MTHINRGALAGLALILGATPLFVGSFPFNSVRAEGSSHHPTVGTIARLEVGDLMCYATVVDDRNQRHEIGATFEICDRASELLNKRVNLTYEKIRVNDCQSIEPCGKTRWEDLISDAEISAPDKQDSIVLSNGKWRLEIGNIGSWDGTNGTGNFSYRGCDNSNNCLELTGGKATCRNGVCTTLWQNREYSYVLEQFVTAETPRPANLIVRKGSRVILRETGFRSL